MKQPRDHAARTLSVTPFQSFFIEADAGSGKTEQLTRAILVRLSVASAPEKILPITFTKKAAAEMGARVFKYLRMGLSDSPPNERHLLETWELAKKALANSESKGWDILNNPGRLQIMTIDSFCLQLINAHPVANKHGGTITPVEDCSLLYERAASGFISTANKEAALVRNNFVSYCGNSSDRAKSYLTSLLGNRDQWLPLLMREDFADTLNKSLKSLVNEDVANLQKIIGDERLEFVRELLGFMRQNLQSESKYSNHILLRSHYGAIHELKNAELLRLFCNIIMTSDFSKLKQTFNKSSGLPAEFKQEKEKLLEIVRDLEPHTPLVKTMCIIPLGDVSLRDIEALELIKAALLYTYAELKVLFKYENCMDFIEITHEALNLTNPDTPHEALLHVDNKYDDILIDEYQDTSSAHHSLVRNIVSHWEPQDGRSLFLVGDPKQSLYLFRSAALGLYLSAKLNGIGNLKIDNLEFSVNFRSYKSIVDWVNETFKLAFPDTDNSNLGAAKHGMSTPFSDKELDDSINYVLSENSGKGNEQNSIEEAVKVADTVEKLRKSVPHETVAILIRSRNYLKHIDAELRSRGLSYRGVDLVKLADSQPIIDLVNLTKTLIEPYDNIALLGLLRSPFVGLLQRDLHRLLTLVDENECSLYEVCLNDELTQALSKDAFMRVKNFLTTHKEARNHYLHTSFRNVLEWYWRELSADSFTEDLQDNDLKSYFNLVSKCEQHNTIKDWDSFEHSLSKLYVQPSSTADDKVVIMTIHKSKGLEFDNVLVPGMHRPSTNSDDNIISWAEVESEGETEFIMACKPAHGKDKSEHLNYIKNLCRRKEVFEMARLAYVGFTRAVKRLYMFASLNLDGNTKEPKQPPSTSLLGLIWEAVKEKVLAAFYEMKAVKLTDTDNKENIEEIPLDTEIFTRKPQNTTSSCDDDFTVKVTHRLPKLTLLRYVNE
tara:strand:- start:90918 stop:93755 length:2838 start_codon:yes stop_codon:yes gene_type:complete